MGLVVAKINVKFGGQNVHTPVLECGVVQRYPNGKDFVEGSSGDDNGGSCSRYAVRMNK